MYTTQLKYVCMVIVCLSCGATLYYVDYNTVHSSYAITLHTCDM